MPRRARPDNTDEPLAEEQLTEKSSVMMTPEQVLEENMYFLDPAKKEDIVFIPSGDHMFDLSIGGGWAQGRVGNIVGDKSTGKTLVAIEATANHNIMFPGAPIYYFEGESAFDKMYARLLGLPVDNVHFPNEGAERNTIEALYRSLTTVVDNSIKTSTPCFYVVDSLDSLTSEDEIETDISKSTYGQAKTKQLSRIFRELIDPIQNSLCTLLIVSQVRDNIGVTFGATKKRAGGNAMDHYCSQVVWLHHVKQIDKTINKHKEIIGHELRTKCTKNKVAMPHRQAHIAVLYAYGLNNIWGLYNFLDKEVYGAIVEPYGITKVTEQRSVNQILVHPEFLQIQKELEQAATRIWLETQAAFLPKVRKYS